MTAAFPVAVAAGLAGVERIELIVEVVAVAPVARSRFAFRHAVNADDQTTRSSTDVPGGGMQVRKHENDEVASAGESVIWSALKAGTDRPLPGGPRALDPPTARPSVEATRVGCADGRCGLTLTAMTPN